MKRHPLHLTLTLLAALGTSALAQDGKSMEFHSSSKPTRQTADEIEDIGAIDSDAGGALARSKFRVNVTAREEFTTNAKLTGSHSASDFVFLPTFEVGYATPLGKQFHFDIAGRVETALYARFDQRSFYGYSANATLDYRPAANWPRIYVSAEPYRYVSYDTGDKITQALGISVGTDWGKSFNGGRSLAYIGYAFTEFFADPGTDDRGQHRAVVGVAHQFTGKLTGQAYYSWSYSDFDIDRRDSRHVVGSSLIYQFAEHWFGSVNASFVDNDSSQGIASYQSFGASLGLTVQF